MIGYLGECYSPGLRQRGDFASPLVDGRPNILDNFSLLVKRSMIER